MAKTISQRISLEGSEQIKKSLEELGKAGQKAFTDIQAAAEKTNFDQQKINSAKQAVDQLVQSGTQLANKFLEIANASAQFGTEGARATQAVTVGLNETNAAADQTSQKIAAVGSTAQQSASTLTTAFRSVAIGIGIVAGAVSGLAVAYTAMGKSASESVLAIGRAASAAGTSIENFSRARTVLQQLGLSSSEAEQVIKRLGTTGKEAFEAVKARLKELGIVLAPISEKNIPAFMEQMQRMSQIMINGKSTFDDNTLALIRMGSAFLGVDGRALRTTERLTQFADNLAKIRDPAKQAALVTTIFGDSLAKVLLPALRRGTGEFVNTIGLIDRLRLGTIEADRVIGEKFMRSWNLLQAVLKKNNEELGLLIAKPITPFLQRFAEAMRNSESVIKFFQTALEKITPALDDLLKLLEGRSGEVKLQWVLDAEKTIRSFGSAVVTVFNDVVVPAFESLKTAAGEVASALNKTFGTDFFTGPIVALGAAIGGLVGWFNALGVAALAAFADTSKGLNPVQQGLQAIGIDVEWLKEKLVTLWEDIKKLFSGQEGEIDNQWLVDLKTAVVDFATSLPGAIAETAAFLGLMTRIVGPANLARFALAQFTGILGLLSNAAVIAGSASFALLNIFRLLLLFMSPLTLVMGALVLALALLAGNTDAARLALALFGVDLDKVNKAIDDYNAKSFEEASARSEQHYQDVRNDFEAVKQAIINAMGVVRQAISDWVTTPIANAWQWIVDTFNDAINWVLAKIEAAWARLKELFSASPERGGTGSEGSVGGFAHGGMVGGRGSGTSDSNLAWVSRGEHIMPARAVRQPGVLAFLEALRRSGGNLERVLDRMSHFALGGLVMPTIPAFAEGGFNGGMNHVTIQFPGLPAIGGLRASSEVVDELRKAAALAQIRSGGRKPSRYS